MMDEREFAVHRSIKAIPTAYLGHRFRSRLEGRWAVFLDLVGIKYQYEREHSNQPWAVGEKPAPRLITSSKTGEVIHPSPHTQLFRPDWPSRRRTLWYLPDFYLPSIDLFIEIKPLIRDSEGRVVRPPMSKQQGLADYHGVSIITLCGTPSEYYVSDKPPFIGFLHIDGKAEIGWNHWCRCPACQTVILSRFPHPHCSACEHTFGVPPKDPEIQQALRDARLWQFDIE